MQIKWWNRVEYIKHIKRMVFKRKIKSSSKSKKQRKNVETEEAYRMLNTYKIDDKFKPKHGECVPVCTRVLTKKTKLFSAFPSLREENISFHQSIYLLLFIHSFLNIFYIVVMMCLSVHMQHSFFSFFLVFSIRFFSFLNIQSKKSTFSRFSSFKLRIFLLVQFCAIFITFSILRKKEKKLRRK